MPLLLLVLLLGVIEGLTEFLPVSSTAHLALTEHAFGIALDRDAFWRLFTIVIQLGAILAVVVYFRQRIAAMLRGTRPHDPPASAPLPAPPAPVGGVGNGAAVALVERPAAATIGSHRALWMVLIGSLPLVIAAVADKVSEKFLGSPLFIAGALVVGGVLMIVIERFPRPTTTGAMEQMTWRQALGIGLAQILAAIFPGTSRSAATIMGGLVAGLSRTAATEFSFFLAIPAMFAATGYSLLKFALKEQVTMDAQHLLLLIIGTLVSFL
ncbi:MAG: undecaprenyl-diphosphate phosphatase, partial [Phycisphaeraceae bacterium]|nr:undecaprenyl-diphosphate phosphatase [Phycisphaeraceae bacterium]